MENKNQYPENEKEKPATQPAGLPEDDDTQFENPSVDPGFETTEEEEDEQQENKKDQQNDALNYNNDRENGAYNPKNI